MAFQSQTVTDQGVRYELGDSNMFKYMREHEDGMQVYWQAFEYARFLELVKLFPNFIVEVPVLSRATKEVLRVEHFLLLTAGVTHARITPIGDGMRLVYLGNAFCVTKAVERLRKLEALSDV